MPFESVDDAAVRCEREALRGDRRPSHIATQMLDPLELAGGHEPGPDCPQGAPGGGRLAPRSCAWMSYARIWMLRKVLNDMDPVESMEMLLQTMKKTRLNGEFLLTIG